MIAFDIVDHDGKHDGAEAKRTCARALDAGLILLSCGQAGQAIRILVPLTASDALIDDGLDRLELALRIDARPVRRQRGEVVVVHDVHELERDAQRTGKPRCDVGGQERWL